MPFSLKILHTNKTTNKPRDSFFTNWAMTHGGRLTLARLIWLSSGSSGGLLSPSKAGATKLKPRKSSWAVALAGMPGESVTCIPWSSNVGRGGGSKECVCVGGGGCVRERKRETDWHTDRQAGSQKLTKRERQAGRELETDTGRMSQQDRVRDRQAEKERHRERKGKQRKRERDRTYKHVCMPVNRCALHFISEQALVNHTSVSIIVLFPCSIKMAYQPNTKGLFFCLLPLMSDFISVQADNWTSQTENTELLVMFIWSLLWKCHNWHEYSGKNNLIL